ncbi:MAG: preprotein translocase subunit SecA [Opitutales bacterium]
MIARIFKLFAGSHYKKFYKKARPIIAKINAFEEEYQSLSDEELKAKTPEFKERIAKGESLESILPEAFATVKNAARRLCGQEILVCGHTLTWQMVHYDVQLIGGIALHQNKIAEMATGEGKTLVSTLPLYLNALTGKNCHLVTVNEYLAKRDCEWMGHLYNFLGISASSIYNQQDSESKKLAYAADITYGTASEFGFDYLRDNGMTSSAADQVQRDLYFCIVDEVDSILVDEARTPLIISGPMQEQKEAPFMLLKPAISRLVRLQQGYCNDLAIAVKKIVDSQKELERGDLQNLWQVKLGMPKNRILRQLMEVGSVRKALDKFDMEMAADFNKEERYAVKERLYYIIDEKQQQSDLTEKGRNTIEPNNPDAFVLPDLPTIFVEIDSRKDLDIQQKQASKLKAEQYFISTSEMIHSISQLLKAYSLYDKDVEYVVQEDKVHIVDQNTGRIMYGRRWSEGLHQAIEAKEGVTIEKETKTYATITVQNYFRMYTKLAGMTGTAETEAQEFNDIYRLNVMAIPTHRECKRIDENDTIYKTRREKYQAAIKEVEEAHRRGQPVLVGTASVEASEVLSRMLRKTNIIHNVLNAKNHEKEAEIIANAGQIGAVTIATNMAGRGTDIKLGEGVQELGGLYVLGTERHESRRIDRQLRGRCARQGDAGRTRFLVSFEDYLLRLFGNMGMISRILDKSMKEGEPIEHPMLNRSIERAQKTVEGQNYSARKRLLQYDDVLNKQREIIYSWRNEILQVEDTRKLIVEFIQDELQERLSIFDSNAEAAVNSDKDSLASIVSWLTSRVPLNLKVEDLIEKSREDMFDIILAEINEVFKVRDEVEDADIAKNIERYVLLQAVDKNWQDHLSEMEDLRKSVGLRSYGQKDPLNEYKSEAYKYFEQLLSKIRDDIMLRTFGSASKVEVIQAMINRLQETAVARGVEQAKEGAKPEKAMLEHKEEVAQVATEEVAQEVQEAQEAPKAPEKELPKVKLQDLSAYGRNDIVRIVRGREMQELKFKKAKELIENEGWRILK